MEGLPDGGSVWVGEHVRIFQLNRGWNLENILEEILCTGQEGKDTRCVRDLSHAGGGRGGWKAPQQALQRKKASVGSVASAEAHEGSVLPPSGDAGEDKSTESQGGPRALQAWESLNTQERCLPPGPSALAEMSRILPMEDPLLWLKSESRGSMSMR